MTRFNARHWWLCYQHVKVEWTLRIPRPESVHQFVS